MNAGDIFLRLKNWVFTNRAPRVRHDLDGDDVTGLTPVADVHYIRLSITQAFLTRESRWFTRLHPLVQSVVRLRFGDRQEDLAQVHDGSRFVDQPTGDGDVVLRNLRLTPLLPFRGGDLTCHVGLVALPGDSGVRFAAKLLADLGEALGTPPLTLAVRAAPVIAEAIGGFAGLDGPSLHLGLVETFDAATFSDRYVALVRATPRQVVPESLRVVAGNLYVASDRGTEPLVGHDWVLLRFEVTDRRDDWGALSEIDKPYRDARVAAAKGDESAAQVALRAALNAAFHAVELTEAHRTVVIQEMKRSITARLADAGKSGAAPAADDLDELVEAADLQAAAKRPIRSLAEAFM
jgi:hypothetical protein